MALAAEVQRARPVSLGRIPFENSQLGIAAMNHKPAHRIGSFIAADLTLVVGANQIRLQRADGFRVRRRNKAIVSAQEEGREGNLNLLPQLRNRLFARQFLGARNQLFDLAFDIRITNVLILQNTVRVDRKRSRNRRHRE